MGTVSKRHAEGGLVTVRTAAAASALPGCLRSLPSLSDLLPVSQFDLCWSVSRRYSSGFSLSRTCSPLVCVSLAGRFSMVARGSVSLQWREERRPSITQENKASEQQQQAGQGEEQKKGVKRGLRRCMQDEREREQLV